MIDLTLKLVQDRPEDSARYFEPVPRLTARANYWRIGDGLYRVEYLAVPRDGGEPLVSLVRQTLKGRDYARGRGLHMVRLSDLDTVNPEATYESVAAYVQQARAALVRVLLDEQRAEPEQGPATADEALAAYTGSARITLTAEGVRRLAAHTGETLGQVEQAARRQGMTVEPQPEPAPSWGGPAATIPVDEDAPMLDDDAEAPEGTPHHWYQCSQDCGRRTMHVTGVCGPCRQLDAAMREQMAQHPEERVDVRDVSALKADPTLTDDEVRAVAFGELPATRAACGCLRIDGEIRHAPACPLRSGARLRGTRWDPTGKVSDALGQNDAPHHGDAYAAAHPEVPFDPPGVAGYDPNTHAAITDPHVVEVIEKLRDAAAFGTIVTLDAADATVLVRYLGWAR